MRDTLKTAITLPGELETLTTADSSPMHIVGHATITIHLKNLRITHHFIVVKSLMTDVILGIDFQKEYRILYDWDEDKRCYIRYKGHFLCYTEDMESGINRVSIAKTIHIPDNGTEFKNQIFDKVTKDLGIERIFSAPYHPQSNGKLETFHKFLKPTLKKMCADVQDNWDDYVEQVLGTYRGVPNLTTGESPFFLVYGRDGNQPVHQLLQPLTRFLGDPDSGLLCLDQHRLSLSIAKKYLDDHRFLTAEKTTDRAEPGFKVGDRVLFNEIHHGNEILRSHIR